jgi:elongation factor Ts
MMTIAKIKQLRQQTGVSISECQKALKASKGDMKKAKETLKKWGRQLAQQKKARSTAQGVIATYLHPNRKIGVLLELNCETDVVAKSADFQDLAHELCLQIAAITEEELPLLQQPWIKDENKTVKELIDEHIAKVGENIVVKRFSRYEI